MKTFKEHLKESEENHLGIEDHTFNGKIIDSEPWEKHFNNKPSLLDREIHSLRVYSGSTDNDILNDSKGTGYRSINEHLRGDHKEETERESGINYHVKNIDSALNKHKTEKHAIVWRGLAGLRNEHTVPNILNSMKPGDIFHDKGYVSTTANPYNANDFSRIYHKNDAGHIKAEYHMAKIKVPKGSKAVYLNSHNRGLGISYEDEVMFPRNSHFRYEGKSVHKIGNLGGDEYHIHHLTHLGSEES